jgi:hypothetical protein
MGAKGVGNKNASCVGKKNFKEDIWSKEGRE